MTNNCNSLHPSIQEFSQQVLWTLRITNSCIALLNIIGNSFLIYALKRTGQITNMSLQLIVLMSASDCINGIADLSFTNIILWNGNNSLCYLSVVARLINHLVLGFSFTTVLLIAIDRFLHMRYFQRYQIIVTKRRGRILCLLLFALEIIVAFIHSMPFLKHGKRIGNLVYASCATLITISVIILYYKTVRTINCRVLSMHNPVMQSTMSHSKALMNVALSISICTVFFLTPYIIAGIILEVGRRNHATSSKEIAIFIWFSYIALHTNGVCSCFIFIVQNTPVKRLLKGMIMH